MQLPLSNRRAGFRGRANWAGSSLASVAYSGLSGGLLHRWAGAQRVNWKVTSLEVVGIWRHEPPQETEHREKSPRLNEEGDM